MKPVLLALLVGLISTSFAQANSDRDRLIKKYLASNKSSNDISRYLKNLSSSSQAKQLASQQAKQLAALRAAAQRQSSPSQQQAAQKAQQAAAQKAQQAAAQKAQQAAAQKAQQAAAQKAAQQQAAQRAAEAAQRAAAEAAARAAAEAAQRSAAEAAARAAAEAAQRASGATLTGAGFHLTNGSGSNGVLILDGSVSYPGPTPTPGGVLLYSGAYFIRVGDSFLPISFANLTSNSIPFTIEGENVIITWNGETLTRPTSTFPDYDAYIASQAGDTLPDDSEDASSSFRSASFTSEDSDFSSSFESEEFSTFSFSDEGSSSSFSEPTGNISAVPEPTTALLLLGGLGALLAQSFRRRQS